MVHLTGWLGSLCQERVGEEMACRCAPGAQVNSVALAGDIVAMPHTGSSHGLLVSLKLPGQLLELLLLHLAVLHNSCPPSPPYLLKHICSKTSFNSYRMLHYNFQLCSLYANITIVGIHAYMSQYTVGICRWLCKYIGVAVHI